MKKVILFVLALSVPLTWSCGSDEVAQALLCDDVCEKLVDECLSLLPGQTRDSLRSTCMAECDADATREQLNCFEANSCTDIILGACW